MPELWQGEPGWLQFCGFCTAPLTETEPTRSLEERKIAKRLYISEHTVRSHVKSLLRKLGVSSRRDALELLSDARR